MWKRRNSLIIFLLFIRFTYSRVEDLIAIKEIKIKGNSYTHQNVILSLCQFSLNDKFTFISLKEKIEKTKQNLIETNYFYEVAIFSLYSEDKKEVKILIEVEEGFLWRFGGGPIYISLGKENLLGKAYKVNIKLGSNTQVLDYDFNFLPLKFFLKNSFYHFSADMFSEFKIEEQNEKFQKETSGINSTLAYQFNHYFSLQLTGELEKLKFNHHILKPLSQWGIEKNKIIYGLTPHLILDLRNEKNKPTKGLWVKMAYKIARLDNRNFSLAKVNFKLYYQFDEKKFFKLQCYTGKASIYTPYYELFNLENSYYNNIDSIRAFGGNNYIGYVLVLLKADYYQHLYTFSIPPVFKIEILGDLFFDLGRTWDKDEKIEHKNYIMAQGPGLKIYLLNPVFLNISLNYSFGKENKIYFEINQTF